MNPHPVIVHFPVALLTLYALAELVRVRRLLARAEWFFVKAAFVITGEIGAAAALLTGDLGKALYPQAGAIIEVHEHFADGTCLIFGVITLAYVFGVIDRIVADSPLRVGKYARAWRIAARVAERVRSGYVIVPLALAGLFLVATTGALGASIVYGVNSDFATKLANTWFVR